MISFESGLGGVGYWMDRAVSFLAAMPWYVHLLIIMSVTWLILRYGPARPWILT